MDFDDNNDSNNGGGFGNGGSTDRATANNDEGRWEDATEEPRNLKASTRLMKSPPSGHQLPGSHNDDDDNNSNNSSNSPRRQQATYRGDRRKNSPAPFGDDEGSDSNETPHGKERNGGGGDGDGAGDDSEVQAARSPRRGRRPDNRAGDMMAKTKQDIRGGTLGGTGGGGGVRSRRPNPSRRAVNDDGDEEEPNGEEPPAESSQFSPSRSRRNPASPVGGAAGRGNRRL